MHRDREIKTPQGQYIYLEKREYGILIKDRMIVNQEGYDLWQARQAQNKFAPHSTSPELAEETKRLEESLKDTKVQDLEKKVDSMGSTLEAILQKLNEKN